MTYVVAEPCVNCRYTDCALVCPVEAFHLDDDMLVIHPETCIDCDACVPECPVEAIFAENNVPAEWTSFTPLNAERALSGLPTISARLDPLCEYATLNEKSHKVASRWSGHWRGSHRRRQCLLEEKERANRKESRRCLGATWYGGDVQG
jgi:ferredoxin